MLLEEQIDQGINDRLQNRLVDLDESKLIKKPMKRKSRYTYPRSELEMMKAKVDNNWACEINSSHKTFINRLLNKPFVEGHHLIPMFYQKHYSYTIDFADNIVTLCPNCHRKIHYGLEEDKYEMILLLYQKREELYPKYGIEINFKN